MASRYMTLDLPKPSSLWLLQKSWIKPFCVPWYVSMTCYITSNFKKWGNRKITLKKTWISNSTNDLNNSLWMQTLMKPKNNDKLGWPKLLWKSWRLSIRANNKESKKSEFNLQQCSIRHHQYVPSWLLINGDNTENTDKIICNLSNHRFCLFVFLYLLKIYRIKNRINYTKFLLIIFYVCVTPSILWMCILSTWIL